MTTDTPTILSRSIRLGWLFFYVEMRVPNFVRGRIFQLILWEALDSGPWTHTLGPIRRALSAYVWAGRYHRLFYFIRIGRRELRLWTKTASARMPRGIERARY